jgi:hypothetical protein
MISKLPRTAAITAVGMLMASAVVIAGAPTASAATCDKAVGLLCGEANNRTGKRMYLTEGFSGSDYCDVWNWGGGTTYNWHHAHCDQEYIGNGHYGGNGTGVDVDAFTFVGQGYHERFSRVLPWHWRADGVWTKISDGMIADCGIGANNEIWCTMLVQ